MQVYTTQVNSGLAKVRPELHVHEKWEAVYIYLYIYLYVIMHSNEVMRMLYTNH